MDAPVSVAERAESGRRVSVMANVSVKKTAVTRAISLCEHSINEFDRTSHVLKRTYDMAGANWRDAKYQQLGGIVNDCTVALTKPIEELGDCITALKALLREIEAYEALNM